LDVRVEARVRGIEARVNDIESGIDVSEPLVHSACEPVDPTLESRESRVHSLNGEVDGTE
jgi:hypothetical protein